MRSVKLATVYQNKNDMKRKAVYVVYLWQWKCQLTA